MEKWTITMKKADFNGIGERFSIDPVTARIIRNRDVVGDEAIEEYLHGDVSGLHNPKSMKDIEKAAAILIDKIKNQKRIRIIGDYDIDGIQSTYILLKALNRCNGIVDTAIPDRILDGYGLNERLILEAEEDGIDTVITCDNGIAAIDAVGKGKALGLTVIITDHHEVPYDEQEDKSRVYRIPPADAVVNPKQEDCGYPYKDLCGAGVAFKLAQVLYEKMGISDAAHMDEVWELLEYAAFATIGDVMELTGENRIIVKEGLKRLRETKNAGLHALMLQNKLDPSEIKAYHVGFILGPCMNASGRLDTAKRALRLLEAQDERTAHELAGDLTDLNASRKDMTARGVEEALELAEEALARGDKVLVLYLPKCHESLAGIIAGRIRERYHRPVYVLTQAEEGVKGSGRSIEAYSMFEEMNHCKELFTKYGGHPMAAGLSMKEGNVEFLRLQLNEMTVLTEEELIPKIKIDVPMPIDYITTKLIEELSFLEPFGKGNEKPVFADKNLELLSARILGKNKNVLKIQLKSSQGRSMEAMYFGDIVQFQEYLLQKFGKEKVNALFLGKAKGIIMSFVYYPDINRFQGKETIQIVIKNYC